jgi:TonB family protein
VSLLNGSVVRYFRSMPVSRSPLETGLAVSLAVHLAVAAAFSWRWKVYVDEGAVDVMEIDLSRPFRITDDPSKAHRALKPGAGAPVVEKPTPIAGKGVAGGEEAPVTTEGKAPVKDWTLPDPNAHQQLENPSEAAPAGQENGLGEGAGSGGLGGTGDGEVDLVYMTEAPRLLNPEQVREDMKRFFPIEERRAAREGLVQVRVHINSKGQVVSVDILQSAGPYFDEAARRVYSRAKFSPAKAGDRSISVALPQYLQFQLSGQ